MPPGRIDANFCTDVDPMCLVADRAVTAAPVPARGDGTVLRASGCGDYLFVSTANAFSVLRGNTQGVKDGDMLQGNVEQIGQSVLFDQTAGRSVFAQVSELHLTQPEITQRIAVRCRASLGATVTSGNVSRANGCDSKIFVNTPQGYAVLERISGGVVGDGDTLSGNFNRPGRITVRDQQSDSTLTVFVDDLWLSASAVQRKIAQSCQRQSGGYSR